MIDYIVRPGDTIYSIARAFNITPERLRLANPEITGTGDIVVRQRLHIPDVYQIRRTIDVNGYTYTDIDSQVLFDTLPYLTYLSILSYQVKPDGSLADINDTPLIRAARQAGVAPMMVIANTDDTGAYSRDVAHAVLTDVQTQQILINNIISILNSKHYFGLNVDFEYLYPSDFDAYARFLQMAAVNLHPLGYIVAISVRVQVLLEQQEQVSEPLDYSRQGRLIDRFILMTSECAYVDMPPMVISPLDRVHRALEYSAAAVSSQKILLGMPNYCYDWALLPQANADVRPLSLIQAEYLAAQVGATIRVDPGSQAPYFEYEDDMGVRHIVWFDALENVRVTLQLVETYNLCGVSFWTINLFSAESYQVLNSMYDIRKVL